MQSSMQEKRKVVLVKREFQVAFISRLVGLVVLGGVLGGITLYTIVGMQLQASSYQLQQLALEAQGSLLASIVLINGLVILLVGGAATWLSVHMLHRVVGPMIRFEQVVRSVAEGDLVVHTTLRRDDELQDFPHALAGMVASLRCRLTRLQTALAAARASVGAAAADPAPEQSLTEASLKIDEAEKVLAEFKLE